MNEKAAMVTPMKVGTIIASLESKNLNISA
jgi:hypothetical protein